MIYDVVCFADRDISCRICSYINLWSFCVVDNILQSKVPMDKEALTIYMENITCIVSLEDAVELSADKLRAIVTLDSPVSCKYLWSI